MFLVKSKQKLLSTMKIPGMTKLFGSNTFNKLDRFHKKKVSKFCKEAGFMRVVEVGQYFVTKDTVILDNINQWLVANTPFHETTELHNQKGGSKEI